MDRLAAAGDDSKYVLPRASIEGSPLDLSFSGLKTAVLNIVNSAAQKGTALDAPSLAASFSKAVSDSLVPRTIRAARMLGYERISVAGGVAANSRLRADFQAAGENAGIEVFLPPKNLCGDNGAMIGCQAYYEFLAGNTAGTDLNAYAVMDVGKLG